MRLIECVPNVSEGRDAGGHRADRRGGQGDAGGGAARLERRPRSQPGRPHLRGRAGGGAGGHPGPVPGGLRRSSTCGSTRARIPRLGAVDVIPFVPLRGVTNEEAVALARRLGEWIGEQGVPVYYYQDAATRPERESLPDVRRGEYEGLAARWPPRRARPTPARRCSTPARGPRSWACASR